MSGLITSVIPLAMIPMEIHLMICIIIGIMELVTGQSTGIFILVMIPMEIALNLRVNTTIQFPMIGSVIYL